MRILQWMHPTTAGLLSACLCLWSVVLVAPAAAQDIPVPVHDLRPHLAWMSSTNPSTNWRLGPQLVSTPAMLGYSEEQFQTGSLGAGSELYGTTSEPPVRSTGNMYLRGWALITGVEAVLLGVTASMPKEWTGWSATFVQDGLDNLGEAYSRPPVWDDDHWFHNYIGHPYGGSVYYNTVRCQGASGVESFFFGGLMSLQWEYVFEAVAEQPSIQDLIITPLAGAALGELVHQLTTAMRENGTNLLEDIVILILNPTSIVLRN